MQQNSPGKPVSKVLVISCEKTFAGDALSEARTSPALTTNNLPLIKYRP